MSDYPAAPSYGVNYGAQDHSQNQSNPAYLPPTYPAQYMQQDDGRIGHGNMSSSYDASMSGFGYNGPAPSFSASAIATGVPPLPIYQGWNQDSIPLPPYSAHNSQQYSGYSDTNAQNNHHNSQYYISQPSYQPPPQVSQPYDEGEVSEGEFKGNSRQMNNSTATHGANQYSVNERTNYGEQHGIYTVPTTQAPQRPYHSGMSTSFQSNENFLANKRIVNNYTLPPR